MKHNIVSSIVSLAVICTSLLGLAASFRQAVQGYGAIVGAAPEHHRGSVAAEATARPRQMPGAAVSPSPSPAASSPTVVSGAGELELINALRTKAGRPALVHDARLDAAAQAKTDDLIARNYYDHALPGESAWQFIPTSLQGRAAAENLHRCMPDVRQRVASWADSPGHYANMVGDYVLWGSYTAVDPRDGCAVTTNYFVK
jgi:uncharacterized protein YkwD